MNISEIKNNSISNIETEKFFKKNSELKKKLDYMEQNYSILESKYDKLLDEYYSITTGRIWKYTRNIRLINEKIKNKKLKKLKNDDKQSILFFVHSWIDVNNRNSTIIGGTTMNVLDIINNIKNEFNCYVLTIINNKYMLVRFINGFQEIYDLGLPVKVHYYDKYDYDFFYTVKKIIEILQIDLLHINHIINFPCDLEFLAREVRTIFTLHDYTTICAKYYYINSSNEICNKREFEKCKKCVEELEINNYENRKKAIQNLFNYTETVIVPDESVEMEVKKYFNIKNIKVIPHGIKLNEFTKFMPYKHVLNKKRINIAFVGNIDGHKGGKICYDLIDNNKDENIYYYLFGLTENIKFKNSFLNFIYKGQYIKNELPKLLNDNHIDLVLLLNNCKETFSYTLSEIFYANIPVLAFEKGGAIDNRIKKDNLGWVIPETKNFEDVTKYYSLIFNSKSYNEKIESLRKYKNIDLQDIMKIVKELYKSKYKRNIKNNYRIKKFLNNYYMKYKIN